MFWQPDGRANAGSHPTFSLTSHSQQPDLFADLPAFRTYARRGLDVELSFAKAAELSAADAKAVFDLCKVGVR